MIRNLLILLAFFLAKIAIAQPAAVVNAKTNQHIFGKGEVLTLEDNDNKLTIEDVQKPEYQSRFHGSDTYYHHNRPKSASWYKVRITVTESIADIHPIIEFFDQTTNYIEAYLPDKNGHYIKSVSGADFPYAERLFQHKNFEFLINNKQAGTYTYYFKVRTRDDANVIIVYRSVGWFIHYALTEYFSYGIFYGIILIFCFHNLLMFLAIRRRQYLIYVFYLLSVGMFEMSSDGIAYQYVWPNSPNWNQYAYGFALYGVSIFALIFAKELLHIKYKAPKFHKLINAVIILRTVYFLFCVFIDKSYFFYKFIEFIPLAIAFAAGINVWWRRKFKPARFFVLGYTFLAIGFVLKAFSVLGYLRFMAGPVSNYCLSYCFVIEMVLLSFAIGDQVRLLRKDKDKAQEETIKQMRINNQLKDTLNQELEKKVEERTKEVIEKSEKIFHQAEIIEKQNEELLGINKQLELQAAEISRMNVLLEQDNIQLKDNIEKVTDARAMSAELSFEEFSAKYPDQEKCNKFLAEIKWTKGFKCIKCANATYHQGRAPYSRRCTKCGYEESVLFNTIFQNSRIPINKAFYLVYLMYTSKGTISSYQLSEKLGIRQSTCWQYAIKVKKVMDERKKGRRNTNEGWSKLIMVSAAQQN